MAIPFYSDGIEFKEVSHRKLNMEIMLIGADMIKSHDYYIDLNRREIFEKNKKDIFKKIIGFLKNI